MLLPRLSALLPLLAVAQAFKNTAPFLMLGSFDLSGLMPATEIAKHTKIESAIARAYTEKLCKDGRHVLISQPTLTQADIQAMPKLMAVATSPKLHGRFQVPHVLDSVDDRLVQKHMVDACGPATIIESGAWSWSTPDTKDAKLAVYRGQPLPEDKVVRAHALKKLDDTLHDILKHSPKTGYHSVVIVSTPRTTQVNDASQYTMEEDHQESFHQELKRDLWKRASNSSSNHTNDNFQDGLPLFERYQYLSPPLFMGLSVSILLLLILYVAVSAIAGLEISYKAFDKEMAPQNQKKQQ